MCHPCRLYDEIMTSSFSAIHCRLGMSENSRHLRVYVLRDICTIISCSIPMYFNNNSGVHIAHGCGEERKNILNIPKPSKQNVTYGRLIPIADTSSASVFRRPWFIISARILPKKVLFSSVMAKCAHFVKLINNDHYTSSIHLISIIHGAVALLLFIFIVAQV